MNEKAIHVEKCPICSESNACCRVQATSSSNCWCYGVDFPRAIFELVPDEKMRKSCICKNCLDTFNKL